jgi:predicted aspartyl protease
MAGSASTLALALVAALSAPPGEPAVPIDDADIVALRADGADRLTVPVAIGASGLFRFLVDTGAQNTIISHELAARLALAPSARALLIGTAGETHVDVVRLDGLMLGSRSFDGLTVPMLNRADIGADGVVGLDSLQRQRVLLDFHHNLMKIEDARRAGNAGFDIVVTARRRSGELIMTDAKIDGVHVDVVIDTGSNATIGNPALAAALARRGAAWRQALPTTLLSVTGQSIPANIMNSRELVVGRLRLGNIAIAYADSPPFARLDLARRPAIFLGMNELRAFKRVAIDFSRREVLFDLPEEQPMTIRRD